MIDHPGANQRSTPERKKHSGKLKREQVEQVFIEALQSGPSSLSHQVRYILALSQLTAAKSTTKGFPETPVPVSGSRLNTLVRLAHTLNNDQLKTLFKDVQQIDDDAVRLCLLVELLPNLPEETSQKIAYKLWEQTILLKNPLIKSKILFALAPFAREMSIEDSSVNQQEETISAIVLANANKNAEGRIRSLLALAYQLPQEEKIAQLNQILQEVDSANNDSLRANLVNSIADRLPGEIENHVVQIAAAITKPADRARALTALARTVSEQLQSTIRQKTLKAIQEIEKEDECSSALVALAPHLEPASEDGLFPDILEQALAIAISFTRRNLRARALVALAPHLTLDLQGEALAAVHSLPSERDRAMMLAELAPTLPPNMLVASLAVAHTMREQDSRVHALTILAHYVPKQAQSQTLLDALAAASNLPHHYERVMALLALVDILPEHLLDQAFTNALETTRHIANENARSRALSLLGHHLPQKLISRVLEAANEITDQQQRFNALIGIIPRVPEADRVKVLKQLLDNTQEIPLAYKRGRTLVALAPHLTQELITDALAITDKLDDPFDRVNAYIALAQNLPPDKRPEVIANAWNLIAQIDDGYDKSSSLASIVPYLPQSARENLVKMADEVVRSIDDEYDRASAITILAALLVQNRTPAKRRITISYFDIVHEGMIAALDIPQQSLRVRQINTSRRLWEDLDPKEQYNLWDNIAQKLTFLPLADVLLCLGTLVPLFESIGSEKQLKEIAYILGIR